MRIIDFLSLKVAVLLFVNLQIGAFAFAKIPCRCSGTFLRCFIFAIRIGSYVYVYIKKPYEETKVLERKATLNFCFGKTETSAQADTEL